MRKGFKCQTSKFHHSAMSPSLFNWIIDSHFLQERTDSLPSRHLPHPHLKDIDLVLGSLDLSRARSAPEPSRGYEFSQVFDLALVIPDPLTVRKLVAFPAPETSTVLGAEAGVSAVTAACWAA